MEPSLAQSMIEAATWAPSSHNTQPWRFEVGERSIALFADRQRALPINDPRDRELVLSCGAALFTLRVAAASNVYSMDVALCPGQGDLLARAFLEEGQADPALAPLGRVVRRRHTTRSQFKTGNLAGPLLGRLTLAAAAEGARLHVVTAAARDALAELVAEGNRRQFADTRFRQELSYWLRLPQSGEGLATFGKLTPLMRPLIRYVNVGRVVARTDAELAREAPALIVLTTARDTELDWLRAGQALSRVLLEAASADVQAGFLNQPCQVEALRTQLASQLGLSEVPQIVARLGIPRKSEVHSSRRPLSEVVGSA